MTDAPDARAPQHDLNRLGSLTHPDPHAFLGAHDTGDGYTILRTLRPSALSVAAVIGGVDYPMRSDGDLFSVAVPISDLVDYRYRIVYPNGSGGTGEFVVADGYRFLPSIGEIDVHLFAEGRHETLWEALGARVVSYKTADGEVTGTAFSVWAPNAKGVAVVGDFDAWGGRAHPMRMVGSSGVWEVFIPDVRGGARYKIRIHGADGVIRDKADPMARQTNPPPATSSIVSPFTRSPMRSAATCAAVASPRMIVPKASAACAPCTSRKLRCATCAPRPCATTSGSVCSSPARMLPSAFRSSACAPPEISSTS